MLLIGLIIACVLTSRVDGGTCQQCKAAYTGTACADITTYLTCLEAAETSPTENCVLLKADSDTIKTDYDALAAGTCDLSKTCSCQYNFLITDLSAGDAEHCTATKKRISCLKTQPDTGCDGTATVISLAGKSETRAGKIATTCTIDETCQCELDYAKAVLTGDPAKCSAAKAFASCLRGKTAAGCAGDSVMTLATAVGATITGLTTTCDVSATVCQCDIEYAQMDIGGDAAKCMALKHEVSCLMGKTGTGCDGSTSMKTAAETARDAITAIAATVTCSKTDVCECEIIYATADMGDTMKKCNAAKAVTACMAKSVANGCGSSKKRMDIGRAVNTNINVLTASGCPLTTACACQVAFNIMDVSDATIKCTASKAYDVCLSAITDDTMKGCDGTATPTTLKADLATLKLCSGSISGMMASLTVVFISAFITMF